MPKIDEDTTAVITEASDDGVPQVHQDATTDNLGACRAQLLVLAGVQSGKRIPLRGDTVIGRAASATICLPDPHISRQHVRIWEERDGSYQLQDLGSHNGTAINGELVEKASRRIRYGDKIRIGQSSLLLFSRYDSMEEQLLQSQKLEALGQLSGGVAHDLNNLLAVILGNVGVVRVHANHPEVSECLDDIETAAERAAGLARQLLNFSTGSRSGQRLVDVSRLSQEVVELARRTFDSSIRIENGVIPGLHVAGDAAELHQSLMNLLINARDAMSEGGTLAVTVRRVDQATGELGEDIPHALITVADTGVGMDAETRQRAFEPFFTTKDKGSGTGLGLSTVHGIIQNHGGRVTLQSEPNRGTTFSVWLPLTEPSQRVDQHDTAVLGPREKRAVLLLDEQQLVLTTVTRLVRSLGFEALAASSLSEALQLLQERGNDVQLVLVDAQTPGSAGQVAFWELRQADSELPVVITSGYDRDDRVQEMLAAGAADFLRKPFTRTALKQTVDKVLGSDIVELDEILRGTS